MTEATSIAVLSNIIFEPHFLPLIKRRFGSNVIVSPISYGEHNGPTYQSAAANADLLVVWLDFNVLFPDCWNTLFSGAIKGSDFIDDVADFCERLYADLTAIAHAKILWFLFEDYYTQFNNVVGTTPHCADLVNEINSRLPRLFSNITFIDTKHLIAEIGINNAYDNKGKYRWNAPYSKAFVEVAVTEIHKQYLIEKVVRKKCLVLDCDNVLWDGVISEDGIENIKLGGSGFGREYQDFQRFVLSLYYHGVILTVCSKNDISDVLNMFREYSEMVLQEDHIACFQVNWEDKPSNIKKIAEKLNIGLDSMVFVDDSPIEIEAVKAMLPEVTAILFKRDMEYEQFSCFNLKNNVSIAEVENRNETYRTNGSREELKAKYADYADYIKALEIKMDIHQARPIEYSRISELTQRTNKCTNGKRYTVAEIEESIASDKVNLYSISVSDRFSDLGIVGALEVDGDILTLFSLSCRALGRKIECKMLEFIADKHKITNIQFKQTGKNADVKTLLLNTFPNGTLTNCETLEIIIS